MKNVDNLTLYLWILYIILSMGKRYLYVIYGVYQKVWIYPAFSKIKTNNEWIFIFFKILPLAFNTFVPVFYLSNCLWFGLVSLFNNISTFVVYLMPKPPFYSCSGIFQPIAEDKWIHTFPKRINQKVNGRGAYDKFPDILRTDTFIDSTRMKF